MSLFTELKRRNVFRVAAAYAVVGWLLAEVSDTVFPRLLLPDWTVTLVIVLLILGLPVALLLSWAYELTPEGVKRAEVVSATESVTPRTGKRIDRLILVGLLAVIAVMAIERVWFAGGSVREPANPATTALGENGGPLVARPVARSIAVLAFEDLSPAGDQEYFADGMSEEILNLLAKVPNLKVTGRTSSFQFKGQHQDLRRIGEVLGVETLLEGSVRTGGNRIRVSAQLVNALDGFHLWSETYDREISDIFAIQDDISRAITEALRVELLGAASAREHPTDNLEAYQLYLQGHHLIMQRGAANLGMATERLQRAVELDPEFALAWADLAVGLAVMPSYSANLDQGTYYERAIQAADRGLALAPETAIAVAVKGLVLFGSARFREGLELTRQAIAMDPRNETIWLWYCVHLSSAGYIDEALKAVERAYEISPATGINAGWLGLLHNIRGDFDLARRFVDESVALGWAFAYWNKADLQLREGDSEGAKQSVHRFLGAMGEPEDGLDLIIDSLRDPSLLPQALAKVSGHLQGGVHYSTLFGGLLLDQAELIVEVLEHRSSDRMTELGFVEMPRYRKIYNRPPFKAYLNRIGLPDFWRQNGWPDFCRPAGADDFECE